MSNETIAERLDAAWVRINAAAIESKDSQRAVLDLIELFETISPTERPDSDEVVTDWALGLDAAKQFDALAVFFPFKIISALPALRELARRFEAAGGPSAPFDWAKVNRLIGQLSAP